MPYSIHHFLSRGGLAFLPLTLAFSMTLPSQAQTDRTVILLAQSQPNAQSKPAPQNNPPVIDPADLSPEQIDPDDPNDFRPLSQSESLLSLAAGQRLMNEAIQAINAERYDVAMDKLQQARKIFNQLSNFHLQLANSFSGIDPKIFEAQRTAALKTGQVRDDATYKLALVHRAKNQPELAVPLLVQVIRSQNPTTDLGRKSYQQLYELGFVDIPFTATGSGTPATPTTPTPPK